MGFLDRLWDSLFGRTDGAPALPKVHRTNDRSVGVAVLDAPQPQSDASADAIADIAQSEGLVHADRWWSPEGVTATEPVWMESVELAGEARALEARLVSYFDGHDLTMPPMPHVAERVLKSLRDPKCSMIDVARALSDDQVTAADVLRLVNSPLYRGTYKITTLQGAVTRLGTQVLRTLMLHQSLRSISFPKKAEAQDLARIIWCRSLASGCVMRELAPLAKLDAEDAFMLGLLHDIGNVIVLRTVCDQEIVSHHWLDESTFEYLCYETHQEFGELIAEQWQLPDSIKAVVASHHLTPEGDDDHARQRWLTMLADMICQMLGYAPMRAYDLAASAPVAALGLSEHPDFEQVLIALPEKIAETLEHFE